MTYIEIGTRRALTAVGGACVRAAYNALSRCEVTYMTRDGEHAAAIVPSGPADKIPVPAELDAVMRHLIQRMRPAFKPDAKPDDTQLLGLALARYLDYVGSDILAVAEAALEDANMHGQAGAVRQLREAIERGESL